MKKMLVGFVLFSFFLCVTQSFAHHVGNNDLEDWEGNEERVHNGAGEEFLPPGMDEFWPDEDWPNEDMEANGPNN